MKEGNEGMKSRKEVKGRSQGKKSRNEGNQGMKSRKEVKERSQGMKEIKE